MPSAPSDHPLDLADRLGRGLRTLRVSVTDRCSFRCRYCMPREAFGPGFAFLPRAEILHFGEIRQLVQVMGRFGVRKVRLTGGEPLLRKELPRLVAMLREVEGIELSMTTNGALLPGNAAALAEAGLDRVTVSLDSLDAETFALMNDTRVPVGQVLAGIDAALEAGLDPVKVNAVVRRGVNDGCVVELARRFKGTGVTVRFIEFMDVGTANGWRVDGVVPGREILTKIDAEMPIEPLPRRDPSDVASRYRYRDGEGEIGVITSVTEPFCGGCTRARLSAEGNLYTCLFAAEGVDLKNPLRDGASDDELAEIIARTWKRRDDRYSEIRNEETRSRPRVEMSYIGG